ncbi:hypothetical protein F5148DRAFT_1208031 [Russula earlei]|uniref:Uncharacterized protein n=1 Tax=Russula earlei TaxID=71964 RepID=A0ACC0U6E2_9AGAM|nr:hypothetical protein F5148DRAFT_1208031 [Russula earlei]
MMSVTLLSLPIDVLLLIRDVISTSPFTSVDPGLGLLAHISLSQTVRRFRDLYTFSSPESEDSFWKRACAGAGYGRPMRREYAQALPGVTPHDRPPPDVLTWKQIAFIVTAHKRVCEIRSCRNASCWPDDMDRRPATLAFHPLFYYLHFSAGAELDPAAVLHTLLPTHPDCRRKLYAPLCGHASAACAFATSPPVRSITLLHPDSEHIIASVRNPDGCAVLDVNRLLGDLLPRSLANMRTVLTHYQTLLDDYRTPDASFPEIMSGGHHRGFLGDHRWVRFTVVCRIH